MAIMVLLLAILLPAPAHAQLFVAAFGGKQVHQDADLALTLEYKMTRVHVDAQVVDGRVDVVFRTHQFALGLGLSFPEHCILEENPPRRAMNRPGVVWRLHREEGLTVA